MIQKRRLRKYREYLESQSLSPLTVEMYYREAFCLETYLKGGKPKKKQVQQYISEMRESHKISTVNGYTVAINRYLKWMNMNEYCVKTKRVQCNWNLENVISIEEYNRLIEYTKKNKKDKYNLIIRILGKTGIRIGELRYITVEALEQQSVMIYGKGKYRSIYLTDDLISEMREYCKRNNIQSGSIFLGNKNTPISRSAVWQMLQKIAEEAGVSQKKVHPHSFRHLFAKTYMEYHGNISELADILGHSGLEITRIYLTTTREEKLRRINELPL